MALDSIRLTKTTFVDSAYEAILQAILTHELRPGERLRSKELAKSLSISRTPVERALERLAGEGLIEFKPGSGPFVFQPSVDDVLDLYDLRVMLELFGVSYAVADHGTDFLSQLEQANEKFSAESSRGETDIGSYIRTSKADKEFHVQLLSACPGGQFSELYDQVTTRIMMAQFAKFGAFFRAGAVQEHEVIVDALRSGDAGDIAVAVYDHVESARSVFITRSREHQLEISERSNSPLMGTLTEMFRKLEKRRR